MTRLLVAIGAGALLLRLVLASRVITRDALTVITRDGDAVTLR